MQKKSKLLEEVQVFLDRDGTIIEEKNYLCDPAQVELLPGAADALRLLTMHGARLFVVTNQSGIGRGYFSVDDYSRVAGRLSELLQAEGIALEGTAFCPHAPEEGCSCRKPGLGMWECLRSRFELSPEKSIMIGDKMDDIRFGLNGGFAASILVLTGYGLKTAAQYALDLPPQQKGKELGEAGSAEHLCRCLHQPGSYPLPAGPHAIAGNLSAAASWILQNFRSDKAGSETQTTDARQAKHAG